MPPKRPTRAIPIINPDPSQPPRPPPLPTTKTIPENSRINSAYQYLKPTLEKIDPARIPIAFPDIEDFIRIDPLDHILTRLFLPQKCENTTSEERFAAFYTSITSPEWDLAFKWKICLEMNAHTLKTLHTTQGADAVVSLAMKRWLQRILGYTLEETWVFTARHSNVRQLDALGLSAVHGDNPKAPPVYHLSEQQSSNHNWAPPYGVYHNRGNIYNPQRAPLPPGSLLQGPQFQGSYSQGVLTPRPIPSLPQRKPHHTTSLPYIYPTPPNPGTRPPQPKPSHKSFTAQERYFLRRPSITATRPSSPVPNPSGRNTPPHKRLPKKNKKRLTDEENIEESDTHSGVGPVVNSWMKAEQNVVPILAAETWTKGKEQGQKEGHKVLAINQPEQKPPHYVASGPESNRTRHLRHVLQGDGMEGNTSALQPQECVESTIDKSYKKKGKQKKVADMQTDQITSNNPTAPQPSKGKGPATNTLITGSQSSSHLAVKPLPNRKKQAKQVAGQILQPTNVDSSSTIYDPITPSRKNLKVTSLTLQSKNPENKYYTSRQAAPEVAIPENDIDEPIINAQTSIKNKNTKKPKPKDQSSVLVKVEGTTNKLPPAQIKVPLGASKILVKPQVNPNQENDHKGLPDNGEDSSNKISGPQHPRQADNLASREKLSAAHNLIPKGSSWLTNGPGLPGFVKSKVSISSGSPENNNAKTASGINRKNTDSKSPTPVKASGTTTTTTYPRSLVSTKAPDGFGSIPHKNTRQPPPPLLSVPSATPKNLDWTPTTTDIDGSSSTSGGVPIKPSTFIHPDTLLSSPPDYAKAASGPNGRNMDQKLHTAPTSPSKNSTASVETTKTIIAPTKSTAPPPLSPTPTKGSPPGATHLRSSKSWSSIVTGNATDLNAINKSFPRNTITIEGFPELVTPLTMLPRAPHETLDEAETSQKPSLSAIAEPFEPVGPRHAVSTDSYLKTNSSSQPVLHNYTSVHSVAPSVMQRPTSVRPVMPILLPQTQIEYMSFPFDCILGDFYDSPEFTKYLNKSYNELLFKENYLRAQYQRISEIFVEEWDYISAPQRKAIVAKALSNLSERVDKVQLSDGIGVKKSLRSFGLTKSPPPTTSLLHKPTNPNLRDAYLRSAPANEETNQETNEEGSKFINKAYLKWRAEYCFDCDPDPLCISPDWLYSIISRLLGMPNTLRHRFGPGEYNRNCDSSVTSNHKDYSTLEKPGLWCPDDCPDCKEAEDTGWPTELTFVRNYTKDSCHSSSRLRSPMLERFPDETEAQERYLPPETSSSQTQNFSTNRESPLMFSQLSILEKARLMSNRFTDPIFARSDKWKTANPGRAKFMELMGIDIALFHCELIQEILQIFGEVRRDRVWIALPTIGDYYEGLPKIPTQPIRGRPVTRSPGEGSSRVRTSIMRDSLDEKQRKKKREDVHICVLGERKRVWEFVNEVQRTMDWKVAGLKLVDRDTDREVERAYDGGLWTIPVPPSEKEMLEREFAKLRVWNK